MAQRKILILTNIAVLINKPNISNEAVLEAAERDLTTLAAMYVEFQLSPYDFCYLCSMHHILFSDLFEWAGELRTIDISKENIRVCNMARITSEQWVAANIHGYHCNYIPMKELFSVYVTKAEKCS